MGMNSKMSRAALLVATLAFVIAPAFTPSFRGYDPAVFPVKIDRPAVQPAAYAFAIWGLIYLWLIAHAGFGLWKRSDNAAWSKPLVATFGAVLLGTVWLAIATRAPLPAAVVIVIMAVLAIAAFLQTEPQQDRWLLSAPLAVFAGWLTAASAVSTGVILAGYGILGDRASALAMLVLVLIVASIVQSRKANMPLYGLTIIWAIIAIAVASWTRDPVVAGAASVGVLIMAALTAALSRQMR